MAESAEPRCSLRSVEFGTILLWFYIADRSSLLFPTKKEYLRDRFAFVFLTLVVVAGWNSTNKNKVSNLLNRQQTEEWKGWMQARPARPPAHSICGKCLTELGVRAGCYQST